MAYDNPSDRRDFEIKVRVNERQFQRLVAQAKAKHKQRNALAYEYLAQMLDNEEIEPWEQVSDTRFRIERVGRGA